MNSGTVHLAFRIYGSFAWPPLPGAADIQRPRDGIVEIYYVREGPDLRAVLRWVKRQDDVVRAPFDPTRATSHLHAVTDAWLTNAFGATEPNDEVTLRLDPDAAGVENGGERLLFRGAQVFDQYDLHAPMEPALRWLLRRRYEQGTGLFFSEVLFGDVSDRPRTSGSTIRFNLALPTPVPQAVVSGRKVWALPFSATFAPMLANPGDPDRLPVRTFAAGSTAAGAVRDVEIGLPNAIADKTLGGFGFCRTDGGAKYLFFPRAAHTDDGDREKFWLDDEEYYRDELLCRLGDVRQMPSSDFQFGRRTLTDPRHGELWDSLEFVQGHGETRMVFRSGIAGWGSTSEGGIDLRVESSTRHFLVRNPDNPRQTIDTQSTRLVVELELGYSLSTVDIWRVGQEDVASPRMTVRLGFDSSMVEENSNQGISFSDLFSTAVAGMHLARVGLQDIMAPQPQSILPHVKSLRGNGARFALVSTLTAGFKSEGALEWGRPGAGPGWSGADFRLSLWPASRLKETERVGSLRATIALPSFAYPGANNATEFPVELVNDPAAASGQVNEFCQFRLVPRGGVAGTLLGRIGGLEFATSTGACLFEDGADPDGGQDYSHLRFGGRAPIRDAADAKAYDAAQLDMRLRLDIATVQPLGIDIPWGDRGGRSPPLLVPLGNAGRGAFILDLRETISGTFDRQLTARLIDRSDLTNETSTGYVVIGQEPFTLTKFHSTPLGNRGAQDNALVAAYDSATRHWELKLVASDYHYEFPPQVAGESMDKPRRLEIHDIDAGDPAANTPYIGSPDSDPVRMRAVEFRLAPSAELWVRPSDVVRGYFLPEWSSYEIFRQSGAYGLGVALSALRGEFLYGLTVGVDTKREAGIARGARVAEIEALIGSPPGRPASSHAPADLAERWERVSKAIARRPERLEIWNRDFDSQSSFSPARFSSGVSFALRETAVHSPAVANYRPPAPDQHSPRVRGHGLRGGALWPIESANLYSRLLERPTSDGGTIERIALSPHGGDSDQKAEFLNHQVAIVSETRGGFVQRHKIEVIGRIGVFWHRAKHVVVYERTVNPSAQFAPEDGSVTRTRRPVLRKVSEYIELLQPSRSYPDFATARPQTTGFLEMVRFNSRIINVDSAWSEDVGDYGWKVPLWNRYAARRRPQVYPRPDIGFVTRAAGEGDRPLAAQECLDPDNLCFFADFVAGGSDTDAWQARIGIDCSALPAPAQIWQTSVKEGGSGQRPLAKVTQIPRGHRRFTWRLAPVSQKTAINAGRSEQPLYAGLETITFMRSSPVENAAFEAALKNANTALGSMTIGQRLPLWTAGHAPTGFEHIETALDAYRKADRTTVLDAAKALKLQLGTIEQAVTNGDVKPYIDAAVAAVANFDGLNKLAGDLPARCEKLGDDLLGSLRRKRLLIVDAVASFESAAFRLIEPTNPPMTVGQLKQTLTTEISDILKHVLADMGTDRLNLKNGVEAARGILRDFEDDVIALGKDFDTKLDEIKRAYDDAKPWSANRLTAFLEKFDAERQRIIGDAETALKDAAARMATELDDLSQPLAAVATEALSAITGSGSDLQIALSKADSGFRAKLHDALTALDALLSGGDDGENTFDRLDARLAAIEASADDLEDRVRQLRALVTSLGARVQATRDGIVDIGAHLKENATEIALAVASITGLASRLVHDLHAVVSEVLAVATAAIDSGLDSLGAALKGIADDVSTTLQVVAGTITAIGAVADWAVDALKTQVRDAFKNALDDPIKGVFSHVDDMAEVLESKAARIEADLAPDRLVDNVLTPTLVQPAIKFLFGGITDGEQIVAKEPFLGSIGRLAETIDAQFSTLSDSSIAAIRQELKSTCDALGGGLASALQRLRDVGIRLIGDSAGVVALIDGVGANADKLLGLASRLDRDVRAIGNDLASSYSAAIAYADRMVEAAGNIGSGGLAAAPGNILRLYAAAASAPDLPNLQFARERLGYYYKELNDVIDTTPAEAWFGRLGDELKALGISLPFDKLGDRLLPGDLSSLDIQRVFKNFGGMNFDRLFNGYKLPRGAQDAIRVTHAFDKKAFRAWVQVDIDIPMPGRRALFAVGPFELDFVNARMVGQVRLEASTDNDRVEQTGRASVATDIEAVVGGQTMVSLQKVVIRYERTGGLKVDLDPKNIRLNPVLRFIQDTLGEIFPDTVGALKIIKQDGVPIGVEHEFAMPPIDLMYGTSGVTNLQIANRFALVAFPDFVISDRFSLSRPELPFLFSIFVVGGTGYVIVETEYRPFDGGLTVMVEAAAGGSAALGFAFGPVSGSVFIALSVALTYRKRIGQSGGGLTVSMLLVVAGNVSVAGIVTIYMGLQLRMSYRDNGEINATGTLALSIRISRFFSITVRTNVQYRLREGRSQMSSSVGADVEVTDQALDGAKSKAKKLLEARD